MDQYINEVQKLNNSESKNKLYFNKKMKIKFLAALASHVMSRVNILKGNNALGPRFRVHFDEILT